VLPEYTIRNDTHSKKEWRGEGMAQGEKEKSESPKRVENKIGRTINLILNNRPSVLFFF